jgi:hypothetical protein
MLWRRKATEILLPVLQSSAEVSIKVAGAWRAL